MFKVFVFMSLLVLSGCDNYPRDTEATLQTVLDSQRLRIGVIEHKPWAYGSSLNPEGVEIRIISDFARSLTARPQWEFLSEAEASDKMELRKLDLVLGGLTADNPRIKKMALTRPYLKLSDDKKDQHVFAVSRGENGFIITLEKFLKAHEKEIVAIYKQEQRK
ncbi:transporter substrate-binding domain-containing protein [Alteromonas pelagimontana]|uniref:Transporter substrate-binding domain-containing protein n=1 Tax=Alteromonas pelagimontana TaxID=1858656 RepID=A0A6M4MC00_9ALTE|nr:transporter substrate-binding domain-containing protein [Alteromonas pelagimontana]QJR80170.1 transporter substrate-binding domain-containing protein [Alteromonas pelagimontana]